LARFAAATRFADLPDAVVGKVKLSILDGLGVCLHGSTLPWTNKVRDMVLEEGGNPIASVWTSGAKVGLTGAVLVNSTAGHAFEMDDIHKESILHPNSLSVPTALALAEADPTLSGRDIVAAVALGTEIGARIGNAATTALFLNGFHPQGTSGAYVAAVTAAHLLNLSPEQMQNAIGIAGSLGAGLMAAQEGAMVKRLHAGRAAQGGLQAALLAKKGFTGISDVVEAGSHPQSGAIARRTWQRLGGGKSRLQDVSQRHQHPCRSRRDAVGNGRGRTIGARHRCHRNRLRPHDVRPYRLGLSPRGRDGCPDEHVLRHRRNGASGRRRGP
jgi:2-methylcitrate dehydratase PrpD